jgi:hypothetical protein
MRITYLVLVGRIVFYNSDVLQVDTPLAVAFFFVQLVYFIGGRAVANFF